MILDAEKDRGPLPLITSPAPGTVLVLDPDLPEGGRRLRLRGNGEEGVRWESQTLDIECLKAPTAILKPGRHWIQAVDEATGRSDRVWIVVEET